MGYPLLMFSNPKVKDRKFRSQGNLTEVNVEIGPKRRVRRPPELLFKFGDYEISRPLTSTHLQHGDRLRTVGWRYEVLIKQPSVPPTVVDGCRIALACKQDQCVSRQQPINGRAGGTQWFRYRSVIVPYKRERLIADQTERCAGEGADQRATLQYFTAYKRSNRPRCLQERQQAQQAEVGTTIASNYLQVQRRSASPNPHPTRKTMSSQISSSTSVD